MKMVYLRKLISQGDGKCFCSEIVKYLLEAGNTINEKDEYGFTFLHYAAQYGQFKVVTCLLKYDANVHEKNINKETPFMLAAEHGRIRVMELLRQHGAQINIRDSSGATALIKAVRHKHKYAVLFLLKQGAFLNAKDTKDHTALSYAAWTGQHELVELLINKGANTAKALECQGPQFVGLSFIRAKMEDFSRAQRERIESEHTMKLYVRRAGFSLGCNTPFKGKCITIIQDYLFKSTELDFRNIFAKEWMKARRNVLFFSAPSIITDCVIPPRAITPQVQFTPKDNDVENIVEVFGACNIS